MKRKVLEISTGILRYDGMSNVLISLIDNAPTDKVEVSVLLGKGAIPEFYEELKKRHVRYYEGPDRELDVKHYIPYLRKLLKSHHFDVVHVHGNSATMALDLFIAKMCGVKTRIAHSHNPYSKHPYIHAVMKPFLNMVTNQPVACGQDAGKFLFNKSFTLVPNCIDVKKFEFDSKAREAERRALHVEDSIVIGHVGRFTYQKNHELLINIFDEYHKSQKNAKLLLIGDGELVGEVKSQIEKQGLSDNVIVYGTSNEIPKLMSAMDAFVFPSRYEGLGITAIEAQASGLPVVASDGMPEEAVITEHCVRVDQTALLSEWVNSINSLISKKYDRSSEWKKVQSAGYDLDRLPQVIEKIWRL